MTPHNPDEVLVEYDNLLTRVIIISIILSIIGFICGVLVGRWMFR
jgi:predicted Co/Zn/Cd cation transporter (cation efflux family)